MTDMGAILPAKQHGERLLQGSDNGPAYDQLGSVRDISRSPNRRIGQPPTS
jgi:hypothetical protein